MPLQVAEPASRRSTVALDSPWRTRITRVVTRSTGRSATVMAAEATEPPPSSRPPSGRSGRGQRPPRGGKDGARADHDRDGPDFAVEAGCRPWSDEVVDESLELA